MPKKKLAVLVGLLVISLAGQMVIRKSIAQESPALSGAKGAEKNTLSARLQDSAEQNDSKEKNLTLELIRQLLVMLVIVALIGGGLWWVMRKFSTGFAGPKGRRIHVTETVSLGPRKRVHVVQVGSKKYLLSSTHENIRFLADITDSYPDELPVETEGS